jgi:hypothetical protein
MAGGSCVFPLAMKSAQQSADTPCAVVGTFTAGSAGNFSLSGSSVPCDEEHGSAAADRGD